MNDCSNCGKSIEVTPTSHVCSTEGKKYVISNYPTQGEDCKTFESSTNKQQIKPQSKDPLINFLNKRKQPKEYKMDDAEKKIIEAYNANMGFPKESKTSVSLESPEKEINFKYALGWIMAAVFGGTLISLWLLGLVR
jgi:hypothetical protein